MFDKFQLSNEASELRDSQVENVADALPSSQEQQNSLSNIMDPAAFSIGLYKDIF